MSIQFAYFDVANTLLEKRGLFETMAAVFAETGSIVQEDLLRERHKILSEAIRFPDKTNRAFYDDFNARLCLAVGVLPHPTLLDQLYDRCRALPWRPFDDTAALRQMTVPLGILSNWDLSLEQKLLGQMDPGIRFVRVLGSQSCGVAKPDPAFFAAALKDLPCDAREVLFVGDSLALDVAPALACGMDAVLLDRPNLFASYTGKKIRSLFELLKGDWADR